MFDKLNPFAKLKPFGINVGFSDLTDIALHPEKAKDLFVKGGAALFTCSDEQFSGIEKALSELFDGGRVSMTRIYYPDNREAVTTICIAKKKGVPLAKPEQGDKL
jgi:hypothetical protein